MQKALEQRLPYLRRFARAMVGNQIAGDELVGATLENLTKYPNTLAECSSIQVALYSTFCEVFRGPIGQECLAAVEVENFPYGSGATLAELSSETRQAFLLTTMEEFSDSEAAEILSLTQEKFSEIKARALAEVAEQLSATIFIIEDELFISSQLEAIVTRLGHLVIGTARTQDEAMQKLKGISPDVILADIHLADGSSGLDTVNEILGAQDDVSVIFITAYSKHLLTGLRPEPTFLIEKPFTENQISAILSQILFLHQTSKAPIILPQAAEV